MPETEQILNSKSVITVAKKLWPSMIFMIIMSVLSLGGLFFLKDYVDPKSANFAILTWFYAMLILMFLAGYVFFIDARMQILGPKPTKKKK